MKNVSSSCATSASFVFSLTLLSRAACGVVLVLGASACQGKTAPSRQATPQDARALVQQFLKPDADHAALTQQLQPTKADYQAIFQTQEMADKAAAMYEPLWRSKDAVIKPKPGQTELLLSAGTSEEIKSWTGTAAQEFPGGYRQAGPLLKPGLTLYAFKFVEPGKRLGMAFDGLVHVNGRFVFAPKLWRLAR